MYHDIADWALSCLVRAQAEHQDNRAIHGDEDDDHYHTVANPATGVKAAERGAGPVKPTGYRPVRKTQ